jgi:methyl-accepting chemotaxis protein
MDSKNMDNSAQSDGARQTVSGGRNVFGSQNKIHPTRRNSMDSVKAFGSCVTLIDMFHDTPADNAEAGASNGNDNSDVADLVKHALQDKGKALQMVKLLVVLGVPLLALIILSTATLVQIFEKFSITKGTAATIGDFLQIDALVTSLQVERGTSARYLSSNGKDNETLSALRPLYVITDKLIRDVDHWRVQFEYSGRVVSSNEEFINVLHALRQAVKSLELSFDESTRKYTAINIELMKFTVTNLEITGVVWSLLVAATATLQASDAIGIQRALGASYFTMCNFPSQIYAWFAQLEGEFAAQQNTAFTYQPSVRAKWRQLLSKDLETTLTTQKTHIYSISYQAKCELLSDEGRFEDSAVWFSNMTTYIVQWKTLRTQLLADIDNLLDSEMTKGSRDAVIYCTMIVIIFIMFFIALSMSVRYAKHVKLLTSKIAKFAGQVGKNCFCSILLLTLVCII